MRKPHISPITEAGAEYTRARAQWRTYAGVSGRSSDSRIMVSFHLPVEQQWLLEETIRYSGGTVPDSHRLPY
jgi:hypothetical protein